MRPRVIPVQTRARSPHQAQHIYLMTAFTLVCAIVLGAGLILGFTKMASLITIPFAVAAVGFVLFQTGGNYDVLHPIRVFGFMWCICLALGSLRLVTPISLWGPTLWAYVTLALLCFIGGFLLMNYFLPRRREGHSGASEPTFPLSNLLPIRTGLIVAVLCLAVGVAAFAYRYMLTGEIPIFASDIGAAGTTFFATASQWRNPEFDTLPNKIIGLLSLFCKYAMYLACIILCQKTRKTRTQTMIAVAVMVIGLFGLGSQGGRGFLVEFAIASAVFFHYLRRRIRLREFAMTGVVLILFLSFAGYYRALTGVAEAANQSRRISKLPDGEVWDSIAFGYFSVTRPMETFYRLTQDLPAMKYNSGGFLFYSLHRITPRENIEELSTVLYGGDMMTPTFLGEFYGDFGLPGIVIGCLILGLMYSYVYWRALRGDSLYWLSVQAIFMVLLMYFPHANFFSQNINWFFDIVNMAWLVRLAQLRRKKDVPAFSSARYAANLTAGVRRARMEVR